MSVFGALFLGVVYAVLAGAWCWYENDQLKKLRASNAVDATVVTVETIRQHEDRVIFALGCGAGGVSMCAAQAIVLFLTSMMHV